MPVDDSYQSEEDEAVAFEDMEVQLRADFAGQISPKETYGKGFSHGQRPGHFYALLRQLADEYDRVASGPSGQRPKRHSVAQGHTSTSAKQEAKASGIAPKRDQCAEALSERKHSELTSSSGSSLSISGNQNDRRRSEPTNDGVEGFEGEVVERPSKVRGYSSLKISTAARENSGPILHQSSSERPDRTRSWLDADAPESPTFSDRSPFNSSSFVPGRFQNDSGLAPEEKTLDVHPRWDKRQVRKFHHGRRDSTGQSQVDTFAEGDDEGHNKSKTTDYNGRLKCLIGLPSTPNRVAWDLVGMVTIMYELFLTPLRVFDPPENTFTDFMDWFALAFWSLDMLVRLTTGFHHNGIFEMNPVKIARNYFRFWFWIDFVVVIPDLAFTIAKHTNDMNSNAGGSVKLLRILRLMRVLRLLRLAKLRWIIANLKDHIDSENIDIFFNVWKLLCALTAFSHFIACAWFALTLDENQEKNWVKAYNLGADEVGWLFQYTSAFRWSLAQFTPSSMPISAQNNVEQVFSILIVFFGLVGFSYLVGSITGSLTELKRMAEEGTQQFWKVRRFLKKANVPMPLRIKIEKYLEHAWQVQKNSVAIGSTPILKLLTEQLRNELNLSMSMPHLEVHPLLAFLSTQCPYAMQRIATKALSRQVFARKECVFHAREIAQHMGFVVAGRLKYIKKAENGKAEHTEWVDKGEDWVTEPAIWTSEWTTLGKLMAVSVSELLVVSSADFADAIIRTPQVFDRVCTYAANFMRWINSRHGAELSDVLQGDQYSDQITKMLWDDDTVENTGIEAPTPDVQAFCSEDQTTDVQIVCSAPLPATVPVLPVAQ